MQSAAVKYRVLFDGRTAYESEHGGVVPIVIDIPPKAKNLELVIDDNGSPNSDWSYWLTPRLYPCSAAELVAGKARRPIRLTEQKPLSATVAHDVFRINNPLGILPPPRLEGVQRCDEYLFAHAPSHLTYAIPAGTKQFTAIGYNVRSLTVKFRVFVDGQGMYESLPAGIVPIRVPLPDGATRLDLIIDEFDGNNTDHSFWCYPRFHGTAD
jgi:hypothetical protein